MRGIVTILLLAVMALPAFAQTGRDFDMCQAKDDPDSNIIGCSAIIAAGNATAESMAVVYGERGFAYIAKGLFDQAAADFTTVIANKPDEADNYTIRGYAYDQGGRRDQAIADYRTAIRLGAPGSPEVDAAKMGLTALGVPP